MQLSAVDALNVPTGHGRQICAKLAPVVFAQNPGAHGVHCVLPDAAYEPAAHAGHGDCRATSLLAVASAHGVHCPCPSASA